MARKNPPTTCRQCGRHRDEAGYVSWRGLCFECAKANMLANNEQISLHQGPYFARQRLHTLLAWGGIPVEVLDKRG